MSKPKLTKQEIERIARNEALGRPDNYSTEARDKSEAEYRSAMKDNAPYLTLGMQMAVTVALGAGIGWWLQNSTGNSMWLGLCAGLGAVFGLTYFIMVVLRMEKQKQQKKN